MAEKSTGAEALLEGMADEMAALVRDHFDALKDTPVVADTAAVEKMMKVVTAVGRATLTVRAVKAAEDKLAEDKAGRLNKLEQMDMNDITPDELEQRADELRARIDRILATLELKRRAQVARRDAGGVGPVDTDGALRAA